MPDVVAGGCRLAYEVEGDGPAVLLAHTLGTERAFWDGQAAALAGRFTVVRYDARGHGGSNAPPGEYTIDQLGRDAVAVLDAAGVERAHVCGLSLGGLAAMWLALHAPERVGRIVLANTAARIASREFWQDRIELVAARGLRPVADAAPQRWFTPAFCRGHADIVENCRCMLLRCSPSGYAACAAALRDADLRSSLAAIAAPSLVISGTFDPVTPPEDAAVLCERIRGCRRVDLDAAHFSNLERADEFTFALLEFFS